MYRYMTPCRRSLSNAAPAVPRSGAAPGPPSASTARAVLAAVCAASVAALSLVGCGSMPAGARAEAGDGTVTVMTWAPQGTKATNMPGMPAMARAYARWVDASGGIAGRRLRVITCNDHNDTVGAARCANLASSEGAVAVVGSYSQYGRSFMSALESEGIPYIGGYGVADEEFTSPLSYPVNGGLPGLVAGNGRQLAAGHCSHVSLVRPDTLAGDSLPTLLDTGLAYGGGPVRHATDVRAPEGASDYTPQAQHALDSARGRGGAAGVGGGHGCVTAVLGGRTGTFFDSFRRLEQKGPHVRTASVLGSVEQSLVDRTGGSESPLEGAYTTGWYPVTGDRRWDPMEKVIREYAFHDNRVSGDDPGVQTTWIAYTVLRHVLESLKAKAVTARSIRNTLDAGRPISTGGLTPRLDWSYGNMLAARDFPRIVNTEVTYQRVRDGRLKAVRSGFVDVGRTLESDPEAE
jgi:hypothetical protein